tara:strand:+ start:477 stop:683 length:207 start_codon:yes stop_codon:yes gene_type:complete
MKKVNVNTSWCADDVRQQLGKDVEHMTDEEILDELDNLYKTFHEACVSSGWDVIISCFEPKQGEANGR